MWRVEMGGKCQSKIEIVFSYWGGCGTFSLSFGRFGGRNLMGEMNIVKIQTLSVSL